MRLRNVGLALALITVTATARAEDGWFSSNGTKIQFRIQGQGEPVVLIHGFSGSMEMYKPVAAELSKKYYVVSLDCRGHGKSDKPHDPKAYGVEMAKDVVRLMDFLRIKKAHVMGYSMGAIITGKLLALYPDRLLSATMGGAAAVPTGDAVFATSKATAEALEKGEGITPIIKSLTPPGQPAPSPEQIKQANAMIMSTNDPLALAAVMRGFPDFAVTDAEMKSNKVPALAMVGTADPFIALARSWAGKMARYKVIAIQGGDHMTTMSKPEYAAAGMKHLTDNADRTPRAFGKAAPLFDGKTLAGWEGPTEKLFRVRDGAIVGGSLTEQLARNEFIATTRTYDNFVLRLKVKLVGTGFVNAGIQVRSRRTADPVNEMSGYQADMGDAYWGAIYDESRRGKLLAQTAPETLKKALKPNEWNDYEIRCEGPRIRLYLNGIQTVDFTEDDPTMPLQGTIGLQVHGGGKSEASYKDIVIEELPK